MGAQWLLKLLLAGSLQATVTAASASASVKLHWAPCASNTALDCATLTVPLEYADPDNGALAHVPIAKYNATVPKSQRKGSLLTNPGGPGSSGIDFLANGAGEGISNVTGGFYDIVSWDPRGVGDARPLLQCWDTAGEEYAASDSVSAAAEIEYSLFRNQSYMPDFYNAIAEYDASVAEIAVACAEHNSSALYTSSAAYTVRDMAAIADVLQGRENATLNYWGFSYGTILGAEFVQTFPERVGRVVFDGVFDPEANAKPYTSQLPHDEVSVKDAIDDLVTFCADAGIDGCALNQGSRNSSVADLRSRIAKLQASLYESPIEVSDGTWSVTVGMFSFFMYSFLKLPTTWPAVASAVSDLETGDPDLFASLLTDATTSTVNESAPDTGSMAGWPLQCNDNAPSNHTNLTNVARQILDISLMEETPWLNADLSTLSFCRNFPNTRPRVQNLGASRLINGETNDILTSRNTSVLIVNALHDAATPVSSAHTLHNWLPTSSQLVMRRGPGHTTISLGSLGLVQTIRDYFLDGVVPPSREVHDLSQVVFPPGVDATSTTPNPVFNGTYGEAERMLLDATYQTLLAFLSLP
ncbi:Alpha/Beta hydrolase protein [Aspergillus undulatus]|uniref:Alpha/Beta hydrolase protein n=1 Tax=Aspergillus undulatus TaxID=1810928 RepID=UPI003CCDD78D